MKHRINTIFLIVATLLLPVPGSFAQAPRPVTVYGNVRSWKK